MAGAGKKRIDGLYVINNTSSECINFLESPHYFRGMYGILLQSTGSFKTEKPRQREETKGPDRLSETDGGMRLKQAQTKRSVSPFFLQFNTSILTINETKRKKKKKTPQPSTLNRTNHQLPTGGPTRHIFGSEALKGRHIGSRSQQVHRSVKAFL